MTEQSSQVALVVKNPPVSVGDERDPGSIPGLGRSPGGGNGNPLQYSCLENPMDRGAWRATVHRVVKSQVQLSVHTQTHTHTGRDRDCRNKGDKTFTHMRSSFCVKKVIPALEMMALWDVKRFFQIVPWGCMYHDEEVTNAEF